MFKFFIVAIFLLAGIYAIFLLGCGSLSLGLSYEGNIRGTIRHYHPDDKAWGIVEKQAFYCREPGLSLEIINLPEEFKIDHLEVSCKVRILYGRLGYWQYAAETKQCQKVEYPIIQNFRIGEDHS